MNFAAACAAVSFLAAPLHAQAFEQQELLPTANGWNSYFGSAVAIDGDTMVVGASYDSTLWPVKFHGAGYVFRRDAATHDWSVEQKFYASDHESGSLFGASVAIDGDVLAIGAPRKDRPGSNDSGAVYVFRFDPVAQSWAQEQKIEASVPAGDELFGTAVDLQGGLLLVGAPRSTTIQGTYSGSAYVFRYAAATKQWSQEQQLIDGDGNAWNESGTAVALDGTTAAIGSPGSTEGSVLGAGCVDLWSVSGTTWTQGQELVPTATDAYIGLGSSLDLREDQLIAGAPGEDASPSVTAVGAAYLFQRVGGSFVLDRHFVSPVALTSEGFGRAVGVDGNLVAIGAPADPGAGNGSGAGYLYRRAKPTKPWVLDQQLCCSSGAYVDEMGRSLAMGDSEVAIGAVYHDSAAGADGGAVEVYAAAEITLEIAPSQPAPGTLVDLDAFRGDPGALVLLVIQDVSGTPLFLPLLTTVFGSDHALHLQVPAPSPAFGLHVGLRAWKISPTGPVVFSTLAYVDV